MVKHELHVLRDLRILTDMSEARQGRGALEDVIESDNLHAVHKKSHVDVKVGPNFFAVFLAHVLFIDFMAENHFKIMHGDQRALESVDLYASGVAVLKVFAALLRKLHINAVVAVEANGLPVGSTHHLTAERLLKLVGQAVKLAAVAQEVDGHRLQDALVEELF